jgi:hypothetical protein
MISFKKLIAGSENRNNTFSGNNRKYVKSTPTNATTSTKGSYLRTCMKIPSTLVNIYKDSRGLRSLIRWLFSISLSLFLLCAIPLSFYTPRSRLNEHINLFRTLKEVFVGWGPLLAISPWCVIVASSITGFSLARECHLSNMADTDVKMFPVSETSDSSMSYPSRILTQNHLTRTIDLLKRPGLRKLFYILGLSLSICLAISIQTNLHMMYPSWFWNPFLLGYNVYWPKSIAAATEGMCIERELSQLSLVDSTTEFGRQMLKGHKNYPLCLSEKSWKSLSTDAISSRDEKDVAAVMNGIRYLKNESGGIAFSVMSRDTINAITALRANVEGFLDFTSNVSVVVFENDSSDGTREAFLEWSKEVEGKYIVDVVECEDHPGCKFDESHRDFEKGIPYERTSAIGRMGEFRQRLVDHILKEPKYENYSHFIVLDIDLSVSISPFGILHSLGKLPNDAVASSGRQPRPGAFGSLKPPYDFSAFVAHETEKNKRMLKLNERFCALEPEGYRWRNVCRAVSVTQFMMIEIGDKLNNGEPYLVDSAFNGAVIYPIELVRKSKAKYDAGKDGQRCEHIGFNLSLKKTMYINPRWNMNLHPHLMGGPSGKRALRTVSDIMLSPIVGPVVFCQSMFSMIVCIYCIMTLVMLIVYPLWVYISRSAIFHPVKSSKKSVRERSKSPSMREIEFLLNPNLTVPSRKRKVSEFDKEEVPI